MDQRLKWTKNCFGPKITCFIGNKKLLNGRVSKRYLVLLVKLLLYFSPLPSLQAKSMSYVVIKLIDLEILQRKQLSMLYVSEE